MKKLYLAFSLFCMLTINNVYSQSFIEEFEDITNLSSKGWDLINNSTPGSTGDWSQGFLAATNPNYNFGAYSGSPSEYISTGFTATGTSANSTLSVWFLMPLSTLNNGDTLSFYTRTATGSQWADRLQVRMASTNSTNVGATPIDVGDFSDLLLDINDSLAVPGYPEIWTQYIVILSGLPSTGVTGRLAFRYFVEDGGPNGNNSFIIGLDQVKYSSISTGITEISNKTAPLIYPNPSRDFALINYTVIQPTTLKIEILNSIGQTVLIQNHKFDHIGVQSVNIDLSTLSAGAYFVKSTTGQINITSKLIKK